MSNRKSNPNRREMRAIRAQQLVFVAIGVIVILSMVLSMLVQ